MEPTVNLLDMISVACDMAHSFHLLIFKMGRCLNYFRERKQITVIMCVSEISLSCPS